MIGYLKSVGQCLFFLVRNEPLNGWTVHPFGTDEPDWVLHLNLGLFPSLTLVMFIRFAV